MWITIRIKCCGVLFTVQNEYCVFVYTFCESFTPLLLSGACFVYTTARTRQKLLSVYMGAAIFAAVSLYMSIGTDRFCLNGAQHHGAANYKAEQRTGLIYLFRSSRERERPKTAFHRDHSLSLPIFAVVNILYTREKRFCMTFAYEKVALCCCL